MKLRIPLPPVRNSSARIVAKGQLSQLTIPFKGSITNRQIEIAWEFLAQYYYARICESIAGKSETIAKWSKNYEKALYGKIRGSAKKRMAFEFLKRWEMATITHKEYGKAMTKAKQIALLAPLLKALYEHDGQFFKGLAEAMQILEARSASNSKGRSIGSGDVHLEKWLLEYAMKTGIIAGALPVHTARELNEQFVKNFRSISDKKLREKCKSLGIPLKPDARGRAAVKYGKSVNAPG